MARLPAKPACVLDVGCASSFFPLLVAALDYQVTGCDLRPYEILNRLKIKNFDFVQGDITQGLLAEGSFDAITCISTLEHVGLGGRYGEREDPEADRAMMLQMRRLLKPGGRLLLTFPYGKAAVLPPFHRIYDFKGTRRLIEGFELREEAYYAPDPNGDWMSCTAREGEQVPGKADSYGLALFHLGRPA